MTERPERDAYAPWWEWACTNLDILLGPQIDVAAVSDKPISIARLLQEAKSSYHEGDEDGIVDLAHIINLVEDLDDLKTLAPEAFGSFKAALTSRSLRDYDYLTGMWFEVRIAKLLARAGLPFSQPDPPDFSVDVDGTIVSVECYAPRAVDGDVLERRTYNAVMRKDRKYRGQPWTTGPSVLALDATWLVRAQGADVVQGEDALSEDLIRGLQKAASSTHFDLVMAFWFGHAVEKQKDTRATSCIYVPSDVETLAVKLFVDRLFEGFQPEDEERIRLPRLPSR